MMLRLEMLPAACGDCLWLEYGTPPDTHIVIIDGGLGETGDALRRRIEVARQKRGAATLPVELLVVTHIDNDHILGVIDLLQSSAPAVHIGDVWFNGKPQLLRLPPAPVANGDGAAAPARTRRDLPPDLMGEDDDESGDEEIPDGPQALLLAGDLLGPKQSDQLSELIGLQKLPCNAHTQWQGSPVMVPDEDDDLPTVTLQGGLRLTVLGPTLARLYKLCTAWGDVLGGTDEPAARSEGRPSDLLGPSDTWPPVWKDGEQRDSSHANGSSIMLLAEYDGHALLLAGDGHAPDLADALKRVRRKRDDPSAPLPLAAFKLPHHGSAKNLSKAVFDQINCSRYLVSTDGSGRPRHPDHQALLRILRYSRSSPQLLFNYAGETTRPWRDSKSDVTDAGFPDYTTTFPANPDDGLVLEID